MGTGTNPAWPGMALKVGVMGAAGLSRFFCSPRHASFKSPRKMGLIARKLTA